MYEKSLTIYKITQIFHILGSPDHAYYRHPTYGLTWKGLKSLNGSVYWNERWWHLLLTYVTLRLWKEDFEHLLQKSL